MSRSPSPHTPKGKLDNATPGTKEVRLGQIIEDLITALNFDIADLAGLRAAVNSGMLSNAGLAIHGAASALVKAGSAFAAIAAGVVVTKTANTDLSALAGTLATAKSAAWAFYIDATGTLTTSAKTADSASSAAALALMTAPPAGAAMIGFITIDNTSGSNFVGGTTALDAGGIAVTYYNSVGPTPFAAAATSTAVPVLSSR